MSYITREKASCELLRLVNAQSAVFTSLQAEARTLVDTLANTADVAMRRERAEIEGLLGQLRAHTQEAVRTVETKLGVHDCEIRAQIDMLVKLELVLFTFADGVSTSII